MSRSDDSFAQGMVSGGKHSKLLSAIQNFRESSDEILTIENQIDEASNDYYAVVRIKDKLGIIDENGYKIFPVMYDGFGFIKNTNEWIEPDFECDINLYECRSIAVKLNNKWGKFWLWKGEQEKAFEFDSIEQIFPQKETITVPFVFTKTEEIKLSSIQEDPIQEKTEIETREKVEKEKLLEIEKRHKNSEKYANKSLLESVKDAGISTEQITIEILLNHFLDCFVFANVVSFENYGYVTFSLVEDTEIDEYTKEKANAWYSRKELVGKLRDDDLQSITKELKNFFKQ